MVSPLHTKAWGFRKVFQRVSSKRDQKRSRKITGWAVYWDEHIIWQKQDKNWQAKQKQLEQLEQRAAESQKLRRDMDAITNRIKDDDNRIRELEDAHGPLDTEKIQRLKNERGRLNLIINPNGNNCHSYRRMQNKPTKYKKKLTNSCLTIEG